jgi:hypothetical protein
MGPKTATADAGLEFTRQQQVPNATKVTFAQSVAGVPVFGGDIGVIVDEESQVLHVTSGAIELGPVNSDPDLSPGEAVALAKLAWGSRTEVQVRQAPRLVIYPGETARLAYEIYLDVVNGYREPWLILIDARDGTTLLQRRMVFESGSRVFKPNPVATLHNEYLRDQNDATEAVPASAYYEVTLENLDPPVDGVYSLKGKYVWLQDIEMPNNSLPTSTTGDFPYRRGDDEFEEVMTYYTVDRSQVYVQSLGFADVNNRAQVVDAHGFQFLDNSRYDGVPRGLGTIFLGVGGVDDAEDADIILHEYGHAIQDNSAPGVYFGEADNGYGNETGAMAEGFADYWAASSGYDSSVAHGFHPEYVGEWDAKGYASGPQAYLRVVNSAKNYPDNMVDHIHTDGEIWSSALWEIAMTAGRTVTDRLVVYSHFLVPPDPDFADGALALMEADALLNPVDDDPNEPAIGAHYYTICTTMGQRGILTCYTTCDCHDHGNPVGESPIDAWDVIYTIDEIYVNAVSIVDPLCPHVSRTDYNCDGWVDVLDLAYVLDYVFLNGDPPCDPCAH